MFIDGQHRKGQADWHAIKYGKVYYDYTERNGVLTKTIFMKSLAGGLCFIRIADKWFVWENYDYYNWYHGVRWDDDGVDPDYD